MAAVAALVWTGTANAQGAEKVVPTAEGGFGVVVPQPAVLLGEVPLHRVAEEVDQHEERALEVLVVVDLDGRLGSGISQEYIFKLKHDENL